MTVVGKDVDHPEPLCKVGGNVNALENVVFKKLKIKFSYNLITSKCSQKNWKQSFEEILI